MSHQPPPLAEPPRLNDLISRSGKQPARARKPFPHSLAERLQEARIANGLGLRELARLTGLSPAYLSQVEHGDRCPRPFTIERLAMVMHMESDLQEALLSVAAESG